MSFLISIEGVHGSGKSTLCRYLADRLSMIGRKTYLINDQTATELGNKLRTISLETPTAEDPILETLLVAAARRNCYETLIKPLFAENNAIIIVERFVDSFFAFGYARRLHVRFIEAVAEAVCEGQDPDMTVLLDISPATALARVPTSARHRVERENIEFHAMLREGYLLRAHAYQNRIHIVDGAELPGFVHENVWMIVSERVQEERI